ncbi:MULTISPECIES: response regulator transcription factor [unclassified Variovorax]|uniref:helix-turn-helix transcriptional regulator n=1 Tax=unclassified Variovorax TaxID=663243 RepID=UPI0008B43A1B|nr:MULTISPECIES: response regulator transcription factor [unclassified Variovorax]SEJ14516.1 regulatory protein, luxR family [Variovorax sp. OK202]SFC05054.1 regulatory protein, luxR family [Variovorax sp. OK212]
MSTGKIGRVALRLASRYRTSAAGGAALEGRPLRWLAKGIAGRGKLFRRSLGVKRWGARARLVALRERTRLIDQMCVLGAMYPGDGASRASVSVSAASPRMPLSPALLKPEVFRKNNTIAAPGAQLYRAARAMQPGHWSAPPQAATPGSALPAGFPAWERDAGLAHALGDDVLPADSAAAASIVGSMFSEANEVELAFLMRLIAEGDSATAARIARRILETKRSTGAEPLAEAAASAPPKARRARAAAPASPERGRGSLSPRELKVLRMISQGLSNREIAETSYRSLHTVDAQVKNIYRKLAVKTRAQAVREAMQRGLLNPEACN